MFHVLMMPLEALGGALVILIAACCCRSVSCKCLACVLHWYFYYGLSSFLL